MNKREFRRWVLALRNERFRRRSSCGCPLAKYLHRVKGAIPEPDFTYVSVGTYKVNGWVRALPPWAEEVRARVDAVGSTYINSDELKDIVKLL